MSKSAWKSSKAMLAWCPKNFKGGQSSWMEHLYNLSSFPHCFKYMLKTMLNQYSVFTWFKILFHLSTKIFLKNCWLLLNCRVYHVTPNLKPTYPVHLQEDPNETGSTEANDTIYQNHFFDFKNARKSGRTRQSDIS